MDARTARCERGFGYIGLLIAVAVLGVTLAATGEVWRTAAKRERERELLFVGAQFRDALASYAGATPAGQPPYPRTLEDLLEDGRTRVVRRHLRRIYSDPMTGKTEWGIIDAPGGGIAGVHSLSEARPLKSGGFHAKDAKLEGAERYSDWKFVFETRSVPQQRKK